MGLNVPAFAKARGTKSRSVLTKCSVDWEFCLPNSIKLVST